MAGVLTSEPCLACDCLQQKALPKAYLHRICAHTCMLCHCNSLDCTGDKLDAAAQHCQGSLHADTWMLMRLWCWGQRCMLPT